MGEAEDGRAFAGRKARWLELVAQDSDLPPNAARVAILLAAHVNRSTGLAWPSVQRLADLLGLSRRGVQKSLAALEQRAHLAREIGRGRTNVYRLVMPNERPKGANVCSQAPGSGCERMFAGVRTGVRGGANVRSPEPLKEPSEEPGAPTAAMRIEVVTVDRSEAAKCLAWEAWIAEKAPGWALTDFATADGDSFALSGRYPPLPNDDDGEQSFWRLAARLRPSRDGVVDLRAWRQRAGGGAA